MPGAERKPFPTVKRVLHIAEMMLAGIADTVSRTKDGRSFYILGQRTLVSLRSIFASRTSRAM